MQNHKKYMKAALENIKKVARQKSAERLVRKAAAKKAPPAPVEPDTPEEDPADELEKELKAPAKVEAEEPADVEKSTTLVVIGAPKRPKAATSKEEPATKRKPGRPRKGA